MESLTWLLSILSPWLGILSLGVFALIPTVYLLSSARPPVKRVQVRCPETGEPLKVHLKINIFRDPLKAGKGLDITSCPQFSGEEILCSKGCIFTAKAQQIHQTAGKRHVEKTAMVVS